MKYIIKTIIIISSLIILSGCDKIITVLKNPNIPVPPISQLDFQKVGVFSAYEDGTFEEVPEDPNNFIDPLYFSEGNMAVFGIDKDGNAVQMKDENDMPLTNKTVIFSKAVKSGVLFSIFDSITE